VQYKSFIISHPAGVWSIVISNLCVCLSVSLSTSISKKPDIHTSPNYGACCQWSWLILLWQHCDMLCLPVSYMSFLHNAKQKWHMLKVTHQGTISGVYEEWMNRSIFIKVHINRRTATVETIECASYRGIKLLEQATKVMERIFEYRIRQQIEIADM